MVVTVDTTPSMVGHRCVPVKLAISVRVTVCAVLASALVFVFVMEGGREEIATFLFLQVVLGSVLAMVDVALIESAAILH